jgi:hypothetical protein
MYRRAVLALAALSLTAACATTHSHPPAPASSPAGNATLTGLLIAVGGPAPGSPRPLPGSVTIDGLVTQHIAVGSDGSYRAVVPAGTYTVTGTSPQYNDGASNCRTDSDTVTLAAGQTVAADVICSEK